MILASDKLKNLRCSDEAKEIYGYLFWWAVKRQSFTVGVRFDSMVKVIQRKYNIWPQQVERAVEELINEGAIYGYEERMINERGLTNTFYFLRDPRTPSMKHTETNQEEKEKKNNKKQRNKNETKLCERLVLHNGKKYHVTEFPDGSGFISVKDMITDDQITIGSRFENNGNYFDEGLLYKLRNWQK